jgi:hypothetical protein
MGLKLYALLNKRKYYTKYYTMAADIATLSSNDNHTSIDSKLFYGEYKGHPINSLRQLIQHGKNNYSRRVYLAGDSSLDNKYWILDNISTAVNGYENILHPPISITDVAYHLNYKMQHKNMNAICINCAVEESTLYDRNHSLLAHDKLIRDNLTEDDIIIISIGGNDVVLKPDSDTVLNTGALLYMNSLNDIKHNFLNCYGAKHMNKIFRYDIQNYIKKLTQYTKPYMVIVCMMYYPDENNHIASWMDKALGLLQYNTKPVIVQTAIEAIYNNSICNIKVKGTNIVPCPVFQVLDGKTTSDYVGRVEPSSTGGEKMAEMFVNILA